MTLTPFTYDSDDPDRMEKILLEQRRLELRLVEQNRMMRQRQQDLLSTLEQLQQREADAAQMAIVAQEALAELRAAQDRLVRSEKLAAIGQLAASMSHDLRNPLGAIRNAWFCIEQLVLRDDALGGQPVITEMARIIDVEIERCARIIGDLLDFARERPPFRVPVDLRELVAEAFRVVARPSPAIELIDEVPDDLPLAFLDGEQFRQVIVNLVQNAVEAVDRQGGWVRVSASYDGQWFEIVIADNGRGIPADVQSRMFEPLFTTKTRGTGLGLAIVASIVKRHGAEISIESEPGSGSRFIIRLPEAEASRGEAPAEGGAADLRS